MLVKVTEQQYLQIFKELIRQNNQENHYYCVISMPIAIHESRNKDYNEEYCNEHNIEVLHSDREGGTIVAFKNDINFFYVQAENKIPREIEFLLQYLRHDKGLNAVLDWSPNLIGRDIIVDGKYKVATFTNSEYNGVVFSAGHISMSADLDLISHICTKPMKKIPKGLSDYGITTEEVENIIIESNK